MCGTKARDRGCMICLRCTIRRMAMNSLLTGGQRWSSFLEAQPGLGKEGLNQVRPLAQAADGQVELLVQLLQVQAHEVTHLHVLAVVPASPVPRIQAEGLGHSSPSSCL